MYMCTYLMVYDGHCDGVGVLLFSVLQQTENNIRHSSYSIIIYMYIKNRQKPIIVFSTAGNYTYLWYQVYQYM